MIRRLDEIASIVPAYQFRGAMQPDQQGSHWAVQAKDIDASFRLDTSSLVRITPQNDPEPYRIAAGDLLFLSRSRYGAAVVNDLPPNAFATGTVYILRVDPEHVHPQYLAWYFAHPLVQAELRGHQSGSSMPFLPKRQLEAIEVALPPLERQRAIAEAAALRREEHEMTLRLDEFKQKQIDGALWRAAQESNSE